MITLTKGPLAALAGFLTFCFPNLSCKNVVVFPSRTVAIENALRLFSPHLAIVDEHLTRHLPRQWLTSLELEVCLTHLLSPGFYLSF